MIGFDATWLGPLLRSGLRNDDGWDDGNRVEGGPRAHMDLVAQAEALLDAIREMEGRVLTPTEARALDMLIEALRPLVGEDEGEAAGETPTVTRP